MRQLRVLLLVSAATAAFGWTCSSLAGPFCAGALNRLPSPAYAAPLHRAARASSFVGGLGISSSSSGSQSFADLISSLLSGTATPMGGRATSLDVVASLSGLASSARNMTIEKFNLTGDDGDTVSVAVFVFENVAGKGGARADAVDGEEDGGTVSRGGEDGSTGVGASVPTAALPPQLTIIALGTPAENVTLRVHSVADLSDPDTVELLQAAAVAVARQRSLLAQAAAAAEGVGDGKDAGKESGHE